MTARPSWWRFSCQSAKTLPLAARSERLMFAGMGEKALGNLDAHAQNLQLRVGVTMIAAALALAVLLLGLGAPAAYRGVLAFPLFFGTYGVYAGLTRTCGFTALRGMRLTESGPTPVADKAERCSHVRRGWQVIVASASIAVCATVLLVIAR